MALNVSTVASWIAGLTFSGVHVVDLNQLPVSVQASMCPLLCPDPSGPFITGLSAEWESFSPGHRTYLAHYTLHYVLFYAPLGASGTIVYQAYPGLVTAAMGIAATFLTHEHPNGADSIRLSGDSVPHFEPVTDSSGNGFHGAKYALEVIELVKGS